MLDSELILLGGNGNGKTEFYDELNSELTSKCRFVDGLSFTTSIKDIHEIIIHHLYEYRKKHMEELIQKYENLVKDGLMPISIADVRDVILVKVFLLTIYFTVNSQFKNITWKQSLQKTSCKIEFATSSKIIKKLEALNIIGYFAI